MVRRLGYRSHGTRTAANIRRDRLVRTLAGGSYGKQAHLMVRSDIPQHAFHLSTFRHTQHYHDSHDITSSCTYILIDIILGRTSSFRRVTKYPGSIRQRGLDYGKSQVGHGESCRSPEPERVLRCWKGDTGTLVAEARRGRVPAYTYVGVCPSEIFLAGFSAFLHAESYPLLIGKAHRVNRVAAYPDKCIFLKDLAIERRWQRSQPASECTYWSKAG